MLAVVGTRKMSAYGRQVLQEIIPALVRAEVTIVSGLAYGIDALAHKIALKHGGRCVAVLGSGVDVVYPAANRRLAEQIIERGGAVISEQPLGMKPLPQFFPARNRIISGLSEAVLVVEAQERSGSLITAQFALEQNRDVFAVPGSIFQSNQRGTNELISQGAIPVLSAPQLVTELGLDPVAGGQQLSLSFDEPAEQQVYEALVEPLSTAELRTSTDLKGQQLLITLSKMELQESIHRVEGSKWARKELFS